MAVCIASPNQEELAVIRNRMFIFVLLIPSVCASTQLDAAEKPPIWVIAHMTNSEKAVRWAARSGANGVETDLQFDDSGNPTVFEHGGICDCACAKYGKNGVCSQLESKCATSTQPATLLKTIAAEHEALGLVIIDSKVGRKKMNLKAAGKNVIGLLDTALFGNQEFKGVAIVSVSERADAGYLQAAAEAAKQSDNAARIYFAIDGRNKVSKVLETLRKLPSANVVYGTGISACSKGSFKGKIETAAYNEKKGVIGFVYIWTIDNNNHAESYLIEGANGVITNRPGLMTAELRKRGYTLATPGTVFPPAK
jgi:glycerophosphoryl diester phosphodiesterase